MLNLSAALGFVVPGVVLALFHLVSAGLPTLRSVVPPNPLARLSSAVRVWLSDHSDRARAIRSAGAAFIIRVVSAALAYLTQVLLARRFGSCR